MDLFDDEQVTTADKIDRPERALEKQAIDDFMKRNPMAGGGMLVQPSVDGRRPGYRSDKVQTAKEVEVIKLKTEPLKNLKWAKGGVIIHYCDICFNSVEYWPTRRFRQLLTFSHTN